jgi:hypothetical protein
MRSWKCIVVGLLASLTITTKARAQGVTAQATAVGLCDEWCFHISYEDGSKGNACESNWPEFGDWSCRATAYDCELDECIMVLITDPDAAELATYTPCEDRRTTGQLDIRTFAGRAPDGNTAEGLPRILEPGHSLSTGGRS